MNPSSPYLSSSSADAMFYSRGKHPVLWNQQPILYRHFPRRTDRRRYHIMHSNVEQLQQQHQRYDSTISGSDKQTQTVLPKYDLSSITFDGNSSQVIHLPPPSLTENTSLFPNASNTLSPNFEYESFPFKDNDNMPIQMRVPLKTIGVRGFTLQDISPSHHFRLQDICEAYTVAYNSPERASQMTNRFAKIGLKLNVHTGVQMDDYRLAFANKDIPAKRLASVFYGHLDNIAKFYETGKPYGLFCEDDVHLHKDLGKELPIIMGEFNAMQLDILLLGYMTTKTIEWWQHGYSLVYDGGAAPYRYHRYPQDQWGIHLFMISRSYAKKLIDAFGPDYAAKAYKDPSMTCCNPDWTLSKHTANRALRYPMMAVEDGKGSYSHHGQGEFHRESHRKNYVEGDFL